MLFLLLSLSAHADSCQEIHGVLDIGSSSAKAVAALVDVCEKKIVKTVYEEQVPISCSETLEKAADGTLPPSFTEDTGAKLQALVARMKEKKAEPISGLATACYRNAKNGGEVAAAFAARAGVPVKVISQEEESELGYLSAMTARKVPLTDQAKVVVWDIGAGSMQMHAESGGRTLLFNGDLASVAFKNRVLEEIQKKSPGEGVSPNPVGKNWSRAVRLAEKEAKQVPAHFRQSKSPRRWIGIGGTIARSVQDQVRKGRDYFTAAEVESTLRRRALLTDEKLGGDFAVTEVTNLALVLGFMKSLGIRKVETAKVSLSQGYLTLQLFNPLRHSPTAAPTNLAPAAAPGTLAPAKAANPNIEPAHP